MDLEEQVPRDRPLRRTKAMANMALKRLSPEFDRMYASAGRALFDGVVWAAGQEGWLSDEHSALTGS